jgi:hypothetical protein
MKRKYKHNLSLYITENTRGIEGGTTMTSFRNIMNTKTLSAVAQKAWQFPRISMHLMMAE